MSGSNMLKSWSEMLGIPFEELEQDYLSRFDKNKKRGQSESAAANNALIQMKSRYTAELRTNAIMFEGIILGISINHYLVSKYDKAKRFISGEAEKEEAISRGMVDEDGEPLDDRSKFNNGKVNPDFGKRLIDCRYGVKGVDPETGEQIPRTYKDKAVGNLYGFCRVKGSEEIKPFVLILNDEQVLKKFPMLTPVSFRANRKEETDIFDLSYSTATKFKTFDDEYGDFSMDKIVSGEYKAITKLDELENYHDTHPSDDYKNFMITKGVVGDMNLEGDYSNSLSLDTLDINLVIDEDGGVPPTPKAFVPKNIPIDFAVTSIVYVFGKTRRSYDRKTNEPGMVNINAYGLYVPEDMKVPIDELEDANNLATAGFEGDDDLL